MDDARLTARFAAADERLAASGARNLLVNSAGLKSGQRLLIVNSPAAGIEPAAVELIAAEARALGATVDVLWTDNAREMNEVSPVVRAAFEAVDVTVLNNRIGAMVRFMPLKGGTYVFNYAITREQLAAPFAQMAPGYWVELLKRLQARLNGAKTFRFTCPNGSDLSGPAKSAVPAGTPAQKLGQTFSTVTFPTGVFVPLSSLEASGRLAMRWFTVSGLRYFDPTNYSLSSHVVVTLENGAITGFEGKADAVAALKSFLGEIGKRYGKDGFVVNSWHAGMNAAMSPYCAIGDDLDEWMRVAHNSPRVAHFHVVGREVPGEYSIVVVDPTITVDGAVLWDKGRLAFADQPDVRQALAPIADPKIAAAFPALAGF